MACDRAHDRALLLSQGLFGAPASQAERDREARPAGKSEQAEADDSSRPR